MRSTSLRIRSAVVTAGRSNLDLRSGFWVPAGIRSVLLAAVLVPRLADSGAAAADAPAVRRWSCWLALPANGGM